MSYVLKNYDGDILMDGATFKCRQDAKEFRKTLSGDVVVSRGASHPRGESFPERPAAPGAAKDRVRARKIKVSRAERFKLKKAA